MEVQKQKIKNAVCRIQMKDKKCCKYEGTGFLFGDGWVMTAAHIFQDDTEPNKGIHNFLRDARFKVSFHVRDPDSPDGTIKPYEFKMQKRMAFAHHLRPGGNEDFKNKDIAMVKLGAQYNYSRKKEDYKVWEREEKRLLDELGQFVTPLSNIAQPTTSIARGSSVYAVYYQADSCCNREKEFKKITVRHGPTEANQNSVSFITLEKKKGVLREGTSGCPILAEKEGVNKYTLAGLHFAGGKDDIDGEAYALPWNESIREYITQGIDIIVDNETYFAYKELGPPGQKYVEESLRTLEYSAKENKLTIYLFDGRVINDQSKEQPLWICCICC